MNDHVYRVIYLVGTSSKSIDDAIQNAVSRASRTLKNLRWFELVEARGDIVGGKVSHYQASVRVGFTIEDTKKGPATDEF